MFIDQIVDSYKSDYNEHAAANQAALTAETEHQMGQMAEQVVWQSQEFPHDSPPPSELYDEETGRPIPLSEMNEEQWRSYRDWKLNDDSYDDALGSQQRTLDNAYDSGRGSADRKTTG
jgi:hypothetical protein